MVDILLENYEFRVGNGMMEYIVTGNIRLI